MARELPKGNFLRHEPCPHCGSSDAYSVYDSNTAYCYSCEKYDSCVDGTTSEVESKTTMNGKLVEGQIKALTARKISKDTCQKFNYQIGRYKGSPCQVASYRRKNRIVAQHLRFADKGFAWLGDSKKVELFGQHLWSPGGRRLVITEGEIDCMSISQCMGNKWPVVSIPSGASAAVKAIKENLEFCCSFREVVLAFDDDKPGREAAAKCAMLFKPGQAKVMSYLGHKDANEVLLAGMGAKLAGEVFNSKPYRPDGIVSGKDLWEVIKEEPKAGVPTLYPQLNQMTLGVRPKELWLFTAGSGIGKSTAVHEILHQLAAEHGQTVGVMALEESIKQSAERHIGIHLNKPITVNRQGIPLEDIRKAYDETVNTDKWWFYDHWGSSDVDNILTKLRYMAVGLGCRTIVLDHISIIVSGLSEEGESERKTLDRLMTALRSLVEETGVTVLAISHLKRKGNQGKSYNEGGTVSLTDLRGSAALEQLSDFVIALERDQQGEDPNLSRLRILKNRPIGKTGVADTLEYNHETGRLLAQSEANPFPCETGDGSDLDDF